MLVLIEGRILTYQLEDWQLGLLKEILSANSNKHLVIFNTLCFMDILAIPHFMAFINFANVSDSERELFFDYWQEASAPEDEIDDEEIAVTVADLKTPLTYIFNCQGAPLESGNYLFINRDIFSDKEKLRLTVLQEIKNVEGKGKLEGGGNPRIERVLRIYKHLVDYHSFSKQNYDKLCEWMLGKTLTERMFYRDMRIIQEVESVQYNKLTKQYELVSRKKMPIKGK